MKDAPQHPFDLIDWLSGGPLAAHIDAFKHRHCNYVKNTSAQKQC
jgi:hypothetical protein